VPKIYLENSDEYALVDQKDVDLLEYFQWYKTSHGYAATNHGGCLLMHRFIMNEPEGYEIDHKNGNRLDNRRKNIRKCTTQQNLRNQSVSKGKKYKGVFPSRNKWKAIIVVSGKHINLGSFIKDKDAAKAYNKAAKKYFGRFAKVNKIDR